MGVRESNYIISKYTF
uniref:Uncharacterized protein n=1 Tax=Oryza punctata TaxID=4537 RepID=A0A0E0JZH7_ORYPU